MFLGDRLGVGRPSELSAAVGTTGGKTLERGSGTVVGEDEKRPDNGGLVGWRGSVPVNFP